MLTPAPCSKLSRALLWLSIKSSSLAWNSRPPTIWPQTSLYLPPVNSLFLQTSPWDVQSYCRNGPPVWKGGQYILASFGKVVFKACSTTSGALEALPGGAPQELLQRHRFEILLPFPLSSFAWKCASASLLSHLPLHNHPFYLQKAIFSLIQNLIMVQFLSQGREQLKTLVLAKLL